MLPPLTLFLQAAYPPDNLDRILEHIRSDHRGTGPNRVANLVLDAIGSPDGQLATTVLDRVLGAAGLFDNVFVGTATLPWQGPGSPYREGMLDAGFRWGNLTLQRSMWERFVELYPAVVAHWYVTYEAALNWWGEPALRAAYEAYLIQTLRDSTGIIPGRAIFWSPAFWSPPPYGIGVHLTRTFSALAAEAERLGTRGLDWLALQDMQGRRWLNLPYQTVADWSRIVNQSHRFAAFGVNLELFEEDPAALTGHAPADPVEVNKRVRFYRTAGVPILAGFEARYWHPIHDLLGAVVAPIQVSPAGWGATVPYDTWPIGNWRPDKWVVHYGGGAIFAGNLNYPSQDREKATLRSWERYHLWKGWRGIAYNYAIGQSGNLYRLRGERHAAATSGDAEPDGIPENSEARAVAFILGGTQRPSEAALLTFRRFWQTDRKPAIVHKDVKGDTACPGVFLTGWVHEGRYKL